MKVYLLAICTVLLLASCANEQQRHYITTGTPITIDTHVSSCPYLTKDAHGNIALSWARELNDSQAVMCYAVSSDGGKTFGNTVVVSPSSNVHPHGENMPKLMFKPSGEIIAVWGAGNPNPKNAYSGLVYYSQSFDAGKSWSSATPLVKDTASYDQRYFDVALLPNGEAAIIWLDNRTTTTKEGSTLYFAATDDRNGFTNEYPICSTCCQCCRTKLYIDKEQNIHAAFRQIINDSIRDMVHIVSTDGGKQFSAPVRISADNWVINGCPHTGPTMVQNNEGLHFAWFTAGGNNGVFYTHSTDNGATYASRDTVSTNSSAKHPQMTILDDGSTLVVWDETVPQDDKHHVWLGLQHRSATGKPVQTQHITADNSIATFPVIKVLGVKQVAIAYTAEEKDKNHVMYQLVSVR